MSATGDMLATWGLSWPFLTRHRRHHVGLPTTCPRHAHDTSKEVESISSIDGLDVRQLHRWEDWHPVLVLMHLGSNGGQRRQGFERNIRIHCRRIRLANVMHAPKIYWWWWWHDDDNNNNNILQFTAQSCWNEFNTTIIIHRVLLFFVLLVVGVVRRRHIICFRGWTNKQSAMLICYN